MDHSGMKQSTASEKNGLQDRAPMVMMALDHYAMYRWVQAPIVGLSLWLIVSPFSLGYTRMELIWSDVVSGLFALALSVSALKPNRGLVSWLVAFVGLWLLFAPLAFWSPDAAAYTNDTIVGALLIAFGLIIPMSMKIRAVVSRRRNVQLQVE